MKTLTRHVVLEGRYVLEQQIGRGKTSSVWRAADTVLDRTVAVKILHPHLAARPETTARFLSAARSAAALSHPNIVSVYDTGKEGKTPFLVMELIEGEPLGRSLERSGPLEPPEAVRIAIAILEAMEVASKAGLSEADLTADEVFIGPADKVRIAGFGDASPAQSVSGKEQQSASARAGALLLYRMLCGRATTSVDPVAPRSIRSRVPKELDAIVMKALSAGPSEGYGTPGELLATLSRFSLGADGRATAEDEPGDGHAEGGGLIRSWTFIPVALVVLAGIAIATGLVAGKLRLGGPLLVRPQPPPPATTPVHEHPLAVREIDIRSAVATDPFGDGHENDANAPLAVDDSRQTAWTTEQYYSGGLSKPGVGLLLDLGTPRTITKFRLDTPQPGFDFELRVGNNPEALAKTRTTAEEYHASAGPVRRAIKPVAGRYVLVWITSVGDSGTASISDFQVDGPVG